MTPSEIDRIVCRWDDRPGVEPGWYCESYSDGQMIEDSQKIWFPVEVDEYSLDAADDLEVALAEAFPGAEIEIG